MAGAGIDLSSDVEAVEAEPAIEPVEMTLGQEAWFAGFHVTFGDLTIVPDGRYGDLEIAATFENMGDDMASLDATIALESAGQPVRESFAMDIPGVQPGDTMDGTFGFSITSDFSIDDAVLTLGTPRVQQVVLPLGANGGEAVSLEPTPLALTGSGSTGQIELTLDGGELRADTPSNYGQMEAGKFALTVTYSATNHGTSAADFVFASENVHLRLPDGTEIGTMGDGTSQSIAGIPSGTTARDLIAGSRSRTPPRASTRCWSSTVTRSARSRSRSRNDSLAHATTPPAPPAASSCVRARIRRGRAGRRAGRPAAGDPRTPRPGRARRRRPTRPSRQHSQTWRPLARAGKSSSPLGMSRRVIDRSSSQATSACIWSTMPRIRSRRRRSSGSSSARSSSSSSGSAWRRPPRPSPAPPIAGSSTDCWRRRYSSRSPISSSRWDASRWTTTSSSGTRALASSIE